jgi:Transposase DDE domain
MPELLWLYLTALRYDHPSVSCVALAEALETGSHARLTRLLQADWSGHTRLALALRPLFVWERGALLIDDPVLSKPFATASEGLAWVFSSQERKPMDGRSLVLLVWTNGPRRSPLGLRRWRKGGPSKDALALEGLSHARHRLRCRPDDVLFDAWYPSRRLLKRLRHDGWDVGCRLKKHRRCHGQPLRRYRRHPSWVETGWRSGGLNVLMVRHGHHYYATNRLTLLAAEVRRLSRVRAPSEEVMRVCQDQLGWSGWQLRSTRAPRPHISCGRAAFCVLERERPDRHLSIYKLKRRLSFQGRAMVLPALERLRAAA